MVTHYVFALVMQEYVKPLNAFYPITFRKRVKFMRNAVLAEGLITQVRSAADLTGNARSFMLALHGKFDCDIKLIDVNQRGKFKEDAQPWIAGYIQFLTDNEVDLNCIAVIRRVGDLKTLDVPCNL